MFTNYQGCDSVHTLVVIINNSSLSTSSVTACDDYTWDGINYTVSGVYDHIYTNSIGCDSIHTLNLTINYSNTGIISENPCFLIPTAFTPNGDGIHDDWQIDGVNAFPNISVKVFNRWGQLIFNSKGYENKWDGTYNGNPLPIAAYYYLIDLGNGDSPFKGTVTIKR